MPETIARLGFQVECPACASSRVRALGRLHVQLGPSTVLSTRVHGCDACGHHFLPMGEEEQRAVERLYGDEYTGYESDPVFSARVREVLDKSIAPRKPPPGKILDVGCGNGEFLVAAAERGYDAEGIDVSKSAAALCRRRGCCARAGDFLTTDFGRRFDIVTFWDVVEHLAAPAAALRRAHDLLQPGGFLVLKIPGYGRLSFPPVAVYPRVARIVLGAPTHVQYFNPKSLQALLTRIGFEPPEWLPAGRFRQRAIGGPLKKRIGRAAARTIAALARNQTLLVTAAP